MEDASFWNNYIMSMLETEEKDEKEYERLGLAWPDPALDVQRHGQAGMVLS